MNQREIKFRAWDTEKRKMLFDTPHKAENINLLADSIRFEIMQFTGLFDKNDKEVFEGDIVKWGHARPESEETQIRIAEVKINPDIQFHSQIGVFYFGSFAYSNSIDRDVEIIGNIYENQKLLSPTHKKN